MPLCFYTVVAPPSGLRCVNSCVPTVPWTPASESALPAWHFLGSGATAGPLPACLHRLTRLQLLSLYHTTGSEELDGALAPLGQLTHLELVTWLHHIPAAVAGLSRLQVCSWPCLICPRLCLHCLHVCSCRSACCCRALRVPPTSPWAFECTAVLPALAQRNGAGDAAGWTLAL